MSAAHSPERRPPWFLLTGLLIGLLAGLGWAWWGDPVQYQNVTPAGLRADYRDELRALLALAYETSGDVGRARARLTELGDVDPLGALEMQGERLAGAGTSPHEARALARLAADLRSSPPEEAARPQVEDTVQTDSAPLAAAGSSGTSSTPGASPPAGTPPAQPTPLPTFTPRPTLTPSATPGAPVALIENIPTCAGVRPGLLEVVVLDAVGQPVPGAPVLVTWLDGQDLFYTGLAPEISPGYADFVMAAGITYTIQVGETGAPVSDLTPQECPTGLGGIQLTFQQP